MSSTLYMVQLAPTPAGLVRFLASQGLNTEVDEDLGYGVHAWLRALFGHLAPKPFRLLLSRRVDQAKLLGYSTAGREALLEYAQTFAEPAAQSVCDLEQDLAAAPMPSPHAWRPGRRLGFEVLVAPLTRRARDGRERDVFLQRAEQAGVRAGLRREPVYIDWLARHIQPAARLEEAHLEEFRLVRQLRLSKAASDGRRQEARLVRPRVLIRGQLIINDRQAFAALLARGIGRHRAFGYGMLLLRPVP